MFSLLKYFLHEENPLPTGALLDSRPKEERVNDIYFSDIVASANPVVWTEKTTYRTFPKLNQNQTNECGAFSARKSLGIMYAQYPKYGQYIDFSSSDIYQRRANKGQPGMALNDIFAILKNGAVLQMLVNDNPKVDADTDGLIIPGWMKTVGEQFAISDGVYVGNDIDTIASIIQTTGKGVILMTYFTSGEWSKQIPYIVNDYLTAYDPSALRHFVVATDFTMKNGVKHLVIEDSAPFGGISNRLMSETWLKKRVVQAGYPMNFKFNVSDKATYDGATIVSAQKCLQSAGYFPTNVAFVENIGPTTRAALAKFQSVNSIPVTSSLDEQTRNLLHKLFP